MGNMFSGLWNLNNKRSLTHKRNPDMQQPNNHHAWMTLRVPGLQQQQQEQHLGAVMTSKTLGRGGPPKMASEAVMPNPDDILPKEAWTDFSGMCVSIFGEVSSRRLL